MGMASHNAIPATLASLVVATPFMSAQARPFAVVSTLDGRTVLPHRIRCELRRGHSPITESIERAPPPSKKRTIARRT